MKIAWPFFLIVSLSSALEASADGRCLLQNEHKLGSWALSQGVQSDASMLTSSVHQVSQLMADLMMDPVDAVFADTVSGSSLDADPVGAQQAQSQGLDILPKPSKKESANEAAAMALCLFGCVGFASQLGYMMHSRYGTVRATTTIALSYTISVFCAVMLVDTIREVLNAVQFGPMMTMNEGFQSKMSSNPTMSVLIPSFGRWVTEFLIFQYSITRWRDCPLSTTAVANIGAHILGFAAIDACGDLQHIAPFNRSPWWNIVGIGVSALVVRGACFLSQRTRHHLSFSFKGKSTIEWDEEKWLDVCEEAEDDFCGLTLGLLISMAVRFFILGTLPNTYENNPKYKSWTDMTMLFLALLALAVVAAAIVISILRYEQIKQWPMLQRGFQLIVQTLWMSVAWMVLSLLYWMFYATTSNEGVALGGKMSVRMIIALGVFVAFSVACYSFCMLGARFEPTVQTTRTFVLFWSLLLGLSCKDVFKQALKSVAGEFINPIIQLAVDMLLRLSLVAVVLPCWVTFILPQAVWGSEHLDTSIPSLAITRRGSISKVNLGSSSAE